MRNFAVACCFAALVGCGTSNTETVSRDPMSEIGNYSPPPAGLKKARVGVADFEDKTDQHVGKEAGVQLETLAFKSKRFNLIDRTQLQKTLSEQGLEGIVDPAELAKPGKVRGVDYLFVGAITNFKHKVVRTNTGFDIGAVTRNYGLLDIDTSKIVIQVDIGVDVKLVNTTTGEIVAKEFGEVKREDAASAWGVRFLGTGGRASNEMDIDQDSKGKLMRWAMDEVFKKMLPDIDTKFSQAQTSYCPKCKTEIEAGKKFCTKCGTNIEPAKCPKCGASVEFGEKFCGSCGNKMEWSK